MPLVTIKTNAVLPENNFAEQAALLAAEQLGKPVKAIAAELHFNPQTAFDGSQAKTGAWIEIASIGFKDKAALAEAFTDFAVNNLKAERELVCIRLINLDAGDVAHGGKLVG